MTITKKIFFNLCLIFLVFLSINAHALSVSLESVKGSGIDKHQLKTVESLAISAIIEHPDATHVTKRGKRKLAIIVTRLENSYIIIMSSDLKGVPTASQQLKVESFDEIDIAIKRLVAAFIENKNVEDTVERNLVVAKEQKEPTRVKALKGFHVDLGMAVPITNSLLSHKIMYAFGLGYKFDISPFLLELRTDLLLGYNEASMNGMSLTIGGHYVWYDQRKYALFSGLEVGFGRVNDTLISGKSGFAVAANTGVILLRHATVNLDVRLRMLMIADKFNNSVPFMGSLLVGITF